ncbi:MAG: hypothetical protein HWN65_16950 [Candidatus Helarchaeota archaeon]|nr:hypothetical protein [Candidatus Helarchaeota archaeon]
MDKKKPDQDRTKKTPPKRRNFDRKPGRYQKRDASRDHRDGRRDRWQGRDNGRRGPRRPRNIRYGTKFCGECRACEFWVNAKFGRYRCENSYLPFEILEFRRDGKNNEINEIVLNLLV